MWHWPVAIAALEKSTELRHRREPIGWLFLAMAHWQLGEKEEARRWYDKAVEWIEKDKPNDKELRRFCAEAKELLGVTENPSTEKEMQTDSHQQN